MTKQEFEERAGTKVTSEQYNKIEFVYTYHPCISNTEGKDRIATIYKIGGMRLIRDMTSTACKARDLEEEAAKYKAELERIKEVQEQLRHPAY